MTTECKNWINFSSIVLSMLDKECTFSSSSDVRVVKSSEHGGISLGVDFGDSLPVIANSLIKKLSSVLEKYGFTLHTAIGDLFYNFL